MTVDVSDDVAAQMRAIVDAHTAEGPYTPRVAASEIVAKLHTFRGTGIQYEEYVDGAEIAFTILTDHLFTDEQWAMIWLTGEQQGIGATRSQGYGRYTVTKWEKENVK